MVMKLIKLALKRYLGASGSVKTVVKHFIAVN